MVEDDVERDAALFLDIILAAQDARRFTAGMSYEAFMASDLHQNAVIRCLTVIGEAAGKVSASTREKCADIEWRDMINMRHRLVNGYADVNLAVVWAVLDDELPKLIQAISPAVPPEDQEEA